MRVHLLLIPFILLTPVYGQNSDGVAPAKTGNPAIEQLRVDLSKLPMNGGWTYGELLDKAQAGDYKANMLLGYYWLNASYRPCKNIADKESPFIQETLNNLHRFFKAAIRSNPTHPAPKMLLTDPCGIFGIFTGQALLPEHEKWLKDCRKLAADGDEDAITALIGLTSPTEDEVKKLIEPIQKKANQGNYSALVKLSKIRVGLLNEEPSDIIPALEKHRNHADMELLFHLGMHEVMLMHEESDPTKKEELKQQVIKTLKPIADRGHATAMVVLTGLQAGPACDYTAQLRQRGDIHLLITQLNDAKQIHPSEADTVKRFLPSEYAARSAVELSKDLPNQAAALDAVTKELMSLPDERGVKYLKEPYTLPIKQLNKLSPQAKTHKELTLAAQIGSVTSCLQLGELWRNDLTNNAGSLPKSLEARQNMSIWYKMAAEEDHPLAKLRLIQLEQPDALELPRTEEAAELLKACAKLASEGDFITLNAISDYLNQDEWQELTKTLRAQAKNNDALAQANLAYLLLFTITANNDTYAEGLGWARLSALQDNPSGMYMLGRALISDFCGISDRHNEGYAWLYRAALKGHVNATTFWCHFYLSGIPAAHNAINRGLAERGHIDTLLYLAEEAAKPSVEIDFDTDDEKHPAPEKEITAEEAELPPWLSEEAIKEQDKPLTLNPEAIRLWGKAGELGSMTALDEMCDYYEKVAKDEKDPAMRQQLLTSAVTATTVLAKKGDPRGLIRLSKFYLEGKGVQQSMDLYRDYVLKAAKTGYPKALIEKARMLIKGDGVDADPKEALAILLKLEAKQPQDVEELYFLLGYMYEEGLGTDRDIDKAFHYYNLGTEQDDDKAMNNLAAMYESGNGIDVNLQKAQMWYSEAAKLGNKQAKSNYERVTAKIKENASDDEAAGGAQEEESGGAVEEEPDEKTEAIEETAKEKETTE